MKSADELTLIAMKREFTRLSKAADKAKNECDEYINIGSEKIAIHEEFTEIVKAEKRTERDLAKLDELVKRDLRCNKILRKDLLKLIDKQHNTEFDRDTLAGAIRNKEYYMKS